MDVLVMIWNTGKIRVSINMMHLHKQRKLTSLESCGEQRKQQPKGIVSVLPFLVHLGHFASVTALL